MLPGHETNIGLVAIAAAVAWDALWLQFVVIPFYRKNEQMYKDYIGNGVIDAAVSFIESQKLIPS